MHGLDRLLSRRRRRSSRSRTTRRATADPTMIDNLHYVKELGLRRAWRRSRAATSTDLRPADARALGAQEEALEPDVATPTSTAGTRWRMENGALGGKLIGAGGGGFLLFYTEQKGRLRQRAARRGPGRGEPRLRL